MPFKRTISKTCPQCEKVFSARVASQVCCSKSCATSRRNWKGGRSITDHGYVVVHTPDRGTVLEHRLVMERIVGRRLSFDETVHHRNQIKSDNRPENLELLDRAEHTRLHMEEYPWSKHSPCCIVCGTTERKHNARGMCNRCYKDQCAPIAWSRKHACCVQCGSTQYKHAGKGLCSSCYELTRHRVYSKVHLTT